MQCDDLGSRPQLMGARACLGGLVMTDGSLAGVILLGYSK